MISVPLGPNTIVKQEQKSAIDIGHDHVKCPAHVTTEIRVTTRKNEGNGGGCLKGLEAQFKALSVTLAEMCEAAETAGKAAELQKLGAAADKLDEIIESLWGEVKFPEEKKR